LKVTKNEHSFKLCLQTKHIKIIRNHRDGSLIYCFTSATFCRYSLPVPASAEWQYGWVSRDIHLECDRGQSPEIFNFILHIYHIYHKPCRNGDYSL